MTSIDPSRGMCCLLSLRALVLRILIQPAPCRVRLASLARATCAGREVESALHRGNLASLPSAAHVRTRFNQPIVGVSLEHFTLGHAFNRGRVAGLPTATDVRGHCSTSPSRGWLDRSLSNILALGTAPTSTLRGWRGQGLSNILPRAFVRPWWRGQPHR